MLVVVGDQALVDGIRYAVMSLAGLTFLSSLYLVPLHPVHFLLTAAGAVWTTVHVLWAAGVVSGGVPAAFLADDRLWLHWLAFGVAAVGLVSQLVHWWSVLQRRRLHRQLLPLQTPPHDCWATISYTEFGRHVPHDRPLFLHVRHPYTSASVGSMKHAFSQPNHLALAGMPAVRYPAVFDPALDRGVDLSDEVQRRRAAIEAVHFTLYLDPTTGNVNLHLHKDSFKCTTFVGVEDPERFSGTDYVGPDLSQLRDSGGCQHFVPPLPPPASRRPRCSPTRAHHTVRPLIMPRPARCVCRLGVSCRRGQPCGADRAASRPYRRWPLALHPRHGPGAASRQRAHLSGH